MVHRPAPRAYCLLPILLLSISLAGVLRAQQAPPRESLPLLGPTFDYDFGVPVAVDRLPGLVNRFNVPGTGESRNHTLRGGASLLFPHLFSRRLGLRFHAGVGVSYGLFESDPFLVDLLDTASGTLLSTANRFTISTTLGNIRLGAGVDLRPGDGPLVFGIGLWGDNRFALEIVEREEILAPDTARFANGEQSRVVDAGERLGRQALRGGADVRIGGRFGLNSALALEPSIRAGVDIASLVDGLASRAWSVGASLSLLMPFGLSGADEDLQTHRIPGLQLDLYAIDGERVAQIGTLQPVRMVHRRVVPLIPFVYFESASPVIPDRYRLIDRAAADSFTMADLSGLDPLSLSRRAVDVIAWRMGFADDARLTLVSRSAPGTDDIARRRAESLRSYLVDVWGISSARIAIRTERIRGGEAEGVEFRCTNSSLVTDPILVEWVEQTFQAPVVGMDRIIPREGGLRRWEVELTRLGSRIAYFEGEGFSDGRELSGRLLIDSIRGTGDEEPIVGNLFVENMLGVRDTAHDVLPLRSADTEIDSLGGVVVDGVLGVIADDRNKLVSPTANTTGELVEGVTDGCDVFFWRPGDQSRAGIGRSAIDLLTTLLGRNIQPSSIVMNPPLHDRWIPDGSPEATLLSTGVSFRIAISNTRTAP